MLDFYYDIASPYSYLAACRIDRLAEAAGVTVSWRPFLLGGVFRSTGNNPPAQLPARGKYMLADLKRWAAQDGVPFRFNPFFPNNSIKVMRILTGVEADRQRTLAALFFKACWVDGRDIADEAVLRELLGEEADALLALTTEQPIKDALRATTDSAVARGAFGAPMLFVGEASFFGNDRLEWAIEAATHAAPRP